MAETLKQLNENMVRLHKISKVSSTKMYVNQHRYRVLMMSLWALWPKRRVVLIAISKNRNTAFVRSILF